MVDSWWYKAQHELGRSTADSFSKEQHLLWKSCSDPDSVRTQSLLHRPLSTATKFPVLAIFIAQAGQQQYPCWYRRRISNFSSIQAAKYCLWGWTCYTTPKEHPSCRHRRWIRCRSQFLAFHREFYAEIVTNDGDWCDKLNCFFWIYFPGGSEEGYCIKHSNESVLWRIFDFSNENFNSGSLR